MVQSKLQANSLNKTYHKKRAGGVVQVIKGLPSKHEAMSSNPSATKEKKKKERKKKVRCKWLTPVISATQEAVIQRILI
jgi:hypothetical protein